MPAWPFEPRALAREGDGPRMAASRRLRVVERMTPIRVVLADDFALFRRGLASLLADEDGFEVVGEAVDGQEALEMSRELMPDLILMDISMPGMDGLEATRRIKAELPYAEIVILTVSDADERLFDAIRCGAVGFFLKDVEPQE